MEILIYIHRPLEPSTDMFRSLQSLYQNDCAFWLHQNQQPWQPEKFFKIYTQLDKFIQLIMSTICLYLNFVKHYHVKTKTYVADKNIGRTRKNIMHVKLQSYIIRISTVSWLSITDKLIASNCLIALSFEFLELST